MCPHLAHGHEGVVVDVVREVLVQVHLVGDHEVEDVVGPEPHGPLSFLSTTASYSTLPSVLLIKIGFYSKLLKYKKNHKLPVLTFT